MQYVKVSRLACIVRSAALTFLMVCSINIAGADANKQQQDEDLKSDDALNLQALYKDKAFSDEETGPIRWLKDGSGYTILEKPEHEDEDAPVDNSGVDDSEVGDEGVESDDESPPRELIFYDPQTGARTVWVSIQDLIPSGGDKPLVIEDYSWSEDRQFLLIYTNSKKVWRSKSRGDYWLLNMDSAGLRKVGGDDKEPSSLMFAKFSPDGRMLAYAYHNDLYAESVDSGDITRLTTDAFATVINGVFDWAYEEEFSIRDGFRWSPDSQRIAFWQLDTSGSKDFILINNTDEDYPKIQTFPYPKVGETVAAARIGSVPVTGGDVVWASLPGDPRTMYIPRMDWAENSQQIMIQRTNRKQDTIKVYYADAASGDIETVLTEEEETFIDFYYDPVWLDDGSAFLWISERNNWRHVFRVNRDGSGITDLTPGEFDVTELLSMDQHGGWVYFTASPVDPSQRYLYRSRLDGSGQVERVTPERFSGSNQYQMSDDGKWAIHNWSSFDQVPVISVISLPNHESKRELVDNKKLRDKLASVTLGSHEFFSVEAQDGVVLDGYLMKPADFSPDHQYPIVIYVYGEPAGSTVQDRWDPRRYLFHQLLLRKGFLVASIDNRGTRAPKGKAWRKSIYGAVGTLASRDQSDALKAMIERWSFIDASRVGIWGHSGGGSMTLNMMFRYPEQYHTGISRAPVPDQLLYDAIYQERYSGLLQEYAVAYAQNSPISYAENLQGNLLLVHGTGDDNVHYQGSERLINELVRHNKQFDFMSYPNRSHSLNEGEGTTLHLNTMMIRYFDRHLNPNAEPSRPAKAQ